MKDLEKRAQGLRRDIIEMVYRSRAGHVGGDLSVIDILVVLFFHEMKISPQMPSDPDRDRFLLSKGHCADALYCVLGEKGFFDKQEAIRTFCQYKSPFIGHPNTSVSGVELNTGSLGHGISVGTGMALAAKMDGAAWRTYVVVGDGEMAEGSNYEGMMAAGHYHLDNLCVTVDCNGLQISGKIQDVMDSSDLAEKFRAFHWNVIEIDGHDYAQLCGAYECAKKEKGRPTVVLAHTIKGKGVSFMENKANWHHGVMTEDQYKLAVQELEGAL